MMNVEIVKSLSRVEPAAWDALAGEHNPFLEHRFLFGLEQSGSVGTPQSGWLPRHILVRDGGRLVGAMPLYEKYDSYGEYIFDWGWAEGAARAGLRYYPKVVSAIPFTPATGCRLLLAPDCRAAVLPAVMEGVSAVAEACQASSVHVLFCQLDELELLKPFGLVPRCSYQFHWQRPDGWHTFGDYLEALRAPARKQVRRERATAAAHGLRLTMRRGTELGSGEWDALYGFYRSTVAEKGAMAYLNRAFFSHLQQAMPERVMAALAYRGNEPVAGALYLTKGQHLYGRYWGQAPPGYDALHFELCYYLPIEWSLAHGINRFEAGAQGEHKIKRGLLPNRCHSAHWLRHPGLADAVGRFITSEAQGVEADLAALLAHTPYRRGP